MYSRLANQMLIDDDYIIPHVETAGFYIGQLTACLTANPELTILTSRSFHRNSSLPGYWIGFA